MEIHVTALTRHHRSELCWHIGMCVLYKAVTYALKKQMFVKLAVYSYRLIHIKSGVTSGMCVFWCVFVEGLYTCSVAGLCLLDANQEILNQHGL